MISTDLLLKSYEAALICRWSDFLCPVVLDELSRQGHVLATALILGKCSSKAGETVYEERLVELAFIRFMRRLALSDISAPVYTRLYEGEHHAEIDSFCYTTMAPYAAGIGESFESRFRDYLTMPDGQEHYEGVAPLLRAASDLVTWWEFGIIEPFNQSHTRVTEVRRAVDASVRRHSEIPGVAELLSDPTWLQVYGQLRTQRRWTRIATMPEFMVAGHCFIVALLAFAWSVEHVDDSFRIVENVFGAVVHDLAEALTRDVSSPVKYGAGIEGVLAEMEREMLTDSLFPHMPFSTNDDLAFVVFDEFADKGSAELPLYDGSVVNVCDKLAALGEAAVSIQNGLASAELIAAARGLAQQWGGPYECVVGLSPAFDELWSRMKARA